MLDGDAQASPFHRLDWWEALHRHCLGGATVQLVGARDGENSAWLPLMRLPARLAPAGSWQALANYYCFTAGPAFSPDCTADDKAALLAAMSASLAKQAWRIDLAPLADETGEVALLATAFAAAGWKAAQSPCDSNHILALNGRDFAGYWQDRPGKLRSTVKRKGAKSPLTLRIASEFSDSDWNDYEHIYANSWKPAEGSAAFLREIAAAEAQAGRLRLGLAHLDGQPIAAQFWTVDHGTAYIHKLAHLADSQEYSPGTLLSAALFRHVIDVDRVAMIDFGTGDDGYKRDWMEAVRPRWRLSMLRPTHPASWPYLARNVLRRGAA